MANSPELAIFLPPRSAPWHDSTGTVATRRHIHDTERNNAPATGFGSSHDRFKCGPIFPLTRPDALSNDCQDSDGICPQQALYSK
ncbi:hypothetical protein G6F65_017807 [Rhizopus arrhizus]|nr:hypothetical protein G6F32_016986 [Rhizopus arrhizus]KAG1252687.1 hypothetical protein G6F65_017807 [Rhizopus arrhizus]